MAVQLPGRSCDRKTNVAGGRFSDPNSPGGYGIENKATLSDVGGPAPLPLVVSISAACYLCNACLQAGQAQSETPVSQ